MLLPSALPCDMRRPSRLTPSRLFSTPPPSDDDFPSRNGLLGTCRTLQSLLNASPASSPRRAKPQRLQSPLHIRPTSSARSRKHKEINSSLKPTRGVNKRRRDRFEEDVDEDTISEPEMGARCRFSTPKRRRQVPYDLPLGLSQSDFYSLHSPPTTQSPPSPAHQRKQDPPAPNDSAPSFDPDAALPSIEEAEEPAVPDDAWTTDDDQRLVEIVLEKFQLSQRDWDECARRIGKDNASVGRRWQALVGDGNVGLRRGRRMVRGRLNESWLQ
ncbi:hypothetical protein BDV59DRAFT_184863 [Aspergillus ambiguus]|uniref:uncharacterized protein n=1 Tax=Aspergillus ambiguus TaxID=176160 RepID=UPI003CCC91F2